MRENGNQRGRMQAPRHWSKCETLRAAAQGAWLDRWRFPREQVPADSRDPAYPRSHGLPARIPAAARTRAGRGIQRGPQDPAAGHRLAGRGPGAQEGGRRRDVRGAPQTGPADPLELLQRGNGPARHGPRCACVALRGVAGFEQPVAPHGDRRGRARDPFQSAPAGRWQADEP